MRNKSESTINGSTAFFFFFLCLTLSQSVSLFFMGFFHYFSFSYRHTRTHKLSTKIDFMDIGMDWQLMVFCLHLMMPSFFVFRPNDEKRFLFFQAKINNFNATFDIFCLLASTFSRFTLQPRTA